MRPDSHADSISRSYYAVFHYLRALLLSTGTETRTHSGAIHLFNTEFVRPGLFSSAHNRFLAGLQRSRELADYDAVVQFSADDAAGERAAAAAFIGEVSGFLRRGGWL